MEEFGGRHTGTETFFETHYQPRRQIPVHRPRARPRTAAAHRLVFHQRIRARMRRAVQSLRRAAPRPARPAAGRAALRDEPARDGRGAHLAPSNSARACSSADNSIAVEPTNRFVSAPELVSDPSYEKPLFAAQARRDGFPRRHHQRNPRPAAGRFHPARTPPIARQLPAPPAHGATTARTRKPARWTASSGSRKSNYEVAFHRERAAERAHHFPGRPTTRATASRTRASCSSRTTTASGATTRPTPRTTAR